MLRAPSAPLVLAVFSACVTEPGAPVGDAGEAERGPPCAHDSDGDGAPDAAEVALFGTDPARFDGGCLPWRRTVVENGTLNTLALGDLDGDGDLDAASSDFGRTVFWYENRGGSFARARGVWDHQLWAPQPYGYWYAEETYWIVIADLDGDGLDDLAMSLGDGIYGVPNLGGGRFGAGQRLVREYQNRELSAADLDADGDTDLVGDERWFENPLVGGGAWTSHLVAMSAGTGEGAADLDGDGDLDLPFQLATSVGWHENLGGAASWTAHTLHTFVVSATSTVVADLDGDGRDELVFAGEEGQQWGARVPMTLVFPNLGAGTFGAPIQISEATDNAAADVDLDGDLDLLGADAAGTAWFVNDGGQLSRLAISGVAADAVLAGDLDGDRRVDLATGPGFVWARNPLRRDADRDGLSSDAEACIVGTDPAVRDADADGFVDGVEVCLLHDPTDPADHP